MHRYGWDWHRGYGWPRPRDAYGREAPWGWGAHGPRAYDRGEGWPWRRDPRFGGDRWRERWEEGWERPRGGGYHGYGYERPAGHGWGGRYAPDDPWAGGGGWPGSPGMGGWRGGYDSARGGFGRGPGWGASYDRFRAPFEDDPGAELDEDYDEDFGDVPWETEPEGVWTPRLDDAELRRRVWRNLMDDGFIDAGSIQIEVQDGVVTLRGEMADYMEARYAWDDAWEAPGVRGVISKLEIRGEARQEAPPDAARKAPASVNTRPAGSRTRKGTQEE